MTMTPRYTYWGRPFSRNGGRQGDPQRNPGKGDENFDESLQGVVYHTAEVAGGNAQDGTQNDADQRPYHRDAEADLAAADYSRQHISTELVGPQEKQVSTLLHTEQPDPSRNDTEEAIARSRYQEPHPVSLFLVDLPIRNLHRIQIQLHFGLIDEGPRQLSVLVDDVHRLVAERSVTWYETQRSRRGCRNGANSATT